MNNLFIKNTFLNGQNVDVLIKNNRFEKIEKNINLSSEESATIDVLDGKDTAILPTYFNGHTHAAMTCLRGYADDMELFKWLNEYIWPYEAKMTDEDIYLASQTAINEMIRTGTTFFSDMYWSPAETMKVIRQAGLRACVGLTFLDVTGEKTIQQLYDFAREQKELQTADSLIQFSLAPHAIYTVCEKNLIESKDLARKLGMKYHIHVSETAQEVADCKMNHGGLTPVQYLDELGVLDENTICAHMVHLSDKDIEIVRDRKVVSVHNPCSNMKLSSGAMRVQDMIDAGCRVILGTDGASSNNNLCMREEMKFAALMAKLQYGPESVSAQTVFDMATRAGAMAFGIDAGRIEVGALADAQLVDLNNVLLQPMHNLISNMVYSADSSVVKHVICNGKLIY